VGIWESLGDLMDQKSTVRGLSNSSGFKLGPSSTPKQSDGTVSSSDSVRQLGMGQNPIPLVNIKIAGKWMFIPLKMVCIGIDP